MNYMRAIMAGSAASLLVGRMGVPAPTRPTSEPQATVAGFSGQEVPVYAGPGYSYAVPFVLPVETEIFIVCYTGDPSDIWYRLSNGYMPQASVYIPPNAPAVPPCMMVHE